MGRRRCCCLGPCPEFNDDFSGDLSDWTVVSGAWEINANDELIETTNSVVIIGDKILDTVVRVWATIVNLQSGETYWVLGAYDADTDAYCYAKLYWDGGATMALSVGTSSAGDLDTVYVTVPDAVDEKISVLLSFCLGPNGGTGTAGDVPNAWAEMVGTGTQAGLKVTGVADGVDNLAFDDYHSMVHHDANINCDDCPCDCEDQIMPHGMTMTFVVVDCPSCTGLDGYTEDATTYDTADKQYEFVFAALPWDIITGGCSESGPFTFRLICPSELGCDQWILENQDWIERVDHNDTPCGWTEEHPAVALPCVCTCDPIYFEYGPFLIVTEVGNCYYKIILTPT